MARSANPPLDHGDVFPPLTLTLADGGALTLPDPEGKQWILFLVYRGHW